MLSFIALTDHAVCLRMISKCISSLFICNRQCSRFACGHWRFCSQRPKLPHEGINALRPAWFCVSPPSHVDTPCSSALNSPVANHSTLTTIINNPVTDNICSTHHLMGNQPHQLLFPTLSFPTSPSLCACLSIKCCH